MGTHIECFFPHTVERTVKAVRARLDALVGLADDLDTIRDRGRFSTSRGGWSLWQEDDGTINSEGPSGLSVSVYPTVAVLTSAERFGAIERTEQGIHSSLRRVFESVAIGFGSDGRLAVALGGFGDTDRANDLALAGAGFEEVCECMLAVMGSPARSWTALEAGEGCWYLRVLDASSDRRA